MASNSSSHSPRTVEEIFKDFSARHAAVLRALTAGTSICPFFLCFVKLILFFFYLSKRLILLFCLQFSDVEEFFSQCDPERDNLCLYGHSNETWEVAVPAEEVPPELPEPVLGINFARDGMERRDWLSLVAMHTDSWLLSVAFYFGARLNRNERYPLCILLVH